MFEITRTYIRFGGLRVHSYALLIVVGMLLAILLCVRREQHYGLPKDTTLDLALCCIPCAIIGARLYFVLFSWKDYIGGPLWKVFAVWEGGLAVYGGILAGFAAGALYARRKKLRFLTLCDLVAPAVALGQAIGRWGNFVNMEAHGGITQVPWLRFFPVSVSIGGEWYYATFFYESAWCMLICGMLLLAERQGRLHFPGNGIAAYALLYTLERTVVEGMRTDSLYIGSVRISQLLSLLVVFAVLAILFMKDGRRRAYLWALVAAFSACVFLTLGAAFPMAVSCFGTLCLSIPTLFRRNA